MIKETLIKDYINDCVRYSIFNKDDISYVGEHYVDDEPELERVVKYLEENINYDELHKKIDPIIQEFVNKILQKHKIKLLLKM